MDEVGRSRLPVDRQGSVSECFAVPGEHHSKFTTSSRQPRRTLAFPPSPCSCPEFLHARQTHQPLSSLYWPRRDLPNKGASRVAWRCHGYPGRRFRAANRHSKVATKGLHRDSIAEILKTAASRAGMNAANIAGHSGRAGMANRLHGPSPEGYKAWWIAGRWESRGMAAPASPRVGHPWQTRAAVTHSRSDISPPSPNV